MLSRLALASSLLLLVSSTALARSAQSEAALARGFPAPPVRALAAVVMDASSGQVLYGTNAHKRLPMASTTKIMTAIIALQHGNLTDRITVPRSAFNFESGATVMGLHPGQVVTLRDLLYGLLLPSGADAADTIAIHYAGSVKAFVALMNKEAVALGMHDTHFMDPHGLTVQGHYSSAYDMAVLGQYASSLPDLMKIAGTRYYTWNGHTLTNLNHVLFWYPGLDGIKPGWIPEAGICQVLDGRRGGRHVVVAILNTPDLVYDARNLLNFGLRDYSWVQSPLQTDSPAITLRGTDASGLYSYFIGSGHYLRGKFLTAYVNSGGFAALGFPRTEPLAEGTAQVQYFQNGALSLNTSTGRISRLAIGLMDVPPTPKPTPTATPTSTPVATPVEGTIHVGTSTPTPKATPTPKVKATPRPTPTPTQTPGSTAAAIARQFAGFQKNHASLLGQVVSKAQVVHGYSFQIFAYGALVYDPKTRTSSLLPLGDRVLSERHFLPGHPGNVYPSGFASPSILSAINWLPPKLTGVSRTLHG